MPTIFKSGSYRFFFYAGDRHEPLHVHVEKNDKIAKLWLNPVRLEFSGGFSRKEIREIQQLTENNQVYFTERWNEYFGD